MSGPPTSISALPIQTDADVSVTEEAVEGIEKDGETFNGLTRPSAAPAFGEGGEGGGGGEEGEGGEGEGGEGEGRVDEPALLPAYMPSADGLDKILAIGSASSTPSPDRLDTRTSTVGRVCRRTLDAEAILLL